MTVLSDCIAISELTPNLVAVSSRLGGLRHPIHTLCVDSMSSASDAAIDVLDDAVTGHAAFTRGHLIGDPVGARRFVAETLCCRVAELAVGRHFRT